VSLSETELVNNWLTSLFSALKANQTNTGDCELSNMTELTKYWQSFMTTANQATAATATQVENTLKLLQLQSQFLSFIVLNSFEFDVFNEQLVQSGQHSLAATSTTEDSSDTDFMPSQSQVVAEKKKPAVKKSSPKNFLNKFVDLVELIKELVQLFYFFIQSQPSLSRSIGKTSLNDDPEGIYGQKFEFVDKQGSVMVL
jgi:hypothetical protein